MALSTDQPDLQEFIAQHATPYDTAADGRRRFPLDQGLGSVAETDGRHGHIQLALPLAPALLAQSNLRDSQPGGAG